MTGLSQVFSPSLGFKLLLVLLLFFCFLNLRNNLVSDQVTHLRSHIESYTSLHLGHKAEPGSPRFTRPFLNFWQSFSQILLDTRPDCEAPGRFLGLDGALVVNFDPDHAALTRPNLLYMPPGSHEELTKKHQTFVNATKDHGLVYRPNTKGIVSTAGGDYLPVFMVSLRMLRRTGSKLPVELFLADKDEYEPYICEEVLPKMNARCVILSEYIESIPQPIEIEKYQYKIFSILFSSFEEVLFLDADNLAIHSPDHLFTTEPFLSHGLVTWPDFWASTASPYFYTIQGTPVPSLTDRPTAESGQLLVSKRSHHSALLLSAYYNYYGPDFYYTLLSQGAPGEGDKDTFVEAAIAVGSRYYQVSKAVNAVGYFDEDADREFHGVSMLQFDPSDDYRLGIRRRVTYVRRRHGARTDGEDGDASSDEPTEPRPLFMHTNYPKMNPATLFEHQGPTRYEDSGAHHRLWGSHDEVMRRLGTDVERALWEEIRYTACEIGERFRAWQGNEHTCGAVEEHVRAVFGE